MQNDIVPKNSESFFGYFFSSVFLIFFLLFKGEISIIFLFLSIITLIITILKPSLLRKPNFLWFRLGLFLNKLISPIILGLIFYFVVTPIGLLLKLFNYDPLQLNNKKNAPSYWHKVSKKETSMKDQF